MANIDKSLGLLITCNIKKQLFMAKNQGLFINQVYMVSFISMDCNQPVVGRQLSPLENGHIRVPLMVSHDSLRNLFSTSFTFILWAGETYLGSCQRTIKSHGYFTSPYQISLFCFCTPSTYCVSIEHYVYVSNCCNRFVYSFFLISLIWISCI